MIGAVGGQWMQVSYGVGHVLCPGGSLLEPPRALATVTNLPVEVTFDLGKEATSRVSAKEGNLGGT